MAGKDKQIQKITHVPDQLDTLFADIRQLILSARQVVARSVDTLQVLTNFQIGRRIVEYEQKGRQRAQYGKEVIKALSSRLTDEFGSGFSDRNLAYMRTFYLQYHERRPILQTVSAKSSAGNKSQTASAKLPKIQKSQTLSDLFPKSGTVSQKLPHTTIAGGRKLKLA